MSFEDDLTTLARRASQLLDHVETEEATKNALVMPFIQVLGYDVFDPAEVVPEFSADVGTRRAEKVDYAIMSDGKPILLLECKNVTANLADQQVSQLFRYFSVTDARIGILTNGIVYQFFSDIEERNKMDLKPFLEVDILSLGDREVRELKRFAKQSFDIDGMLEAAISLKYTRGMKQVLSQQLDSPDDDFVEWLARQVYSGRLTQAVREQFSVLSRLAFNEFINDRINATLKNALARDSGEQPAVQPADIAEAEADESESEDTGKGIVTTAAEVEGYLIVKAILRDVVDVSRVAIRDTKSYCGVLLDDTNRKPLCRLRFNSKQKQIGVFDEHKNEEVHAIDSLDDLYQYAERIRAMVGHYE